MSTYNICFHGDIFLVEKKKKKKKKNGISADIIQAIFQLTNHRTISDH